MPRAAVSANKSLSRSGSRWSRGKRSASSPWMSQDPMVHWPIVAAKRLGSK